MSTTFVSPIDKLWPTERPMLRNVALVLFGTLLLYASAKVQVPFWPVPMTMQTAVVVLIGMAYGWRLGAATVVAYLAEGAVGLPVFVGTPERGIGLAYMVGPTGGYLLGFVAAAAIAGWIVQGGHGLARMALAVTGGILAIFVVGVAWLSVLIGFDNAIVHGVLPFLPSEIAKILFAIAVGVGMFRLRRQA
ncbi:MAG TPA: biotin transporter BioY [Geminicoccus sp.]|jgi:biotin transport system substrate-specific component|uniref:biotin transporter BioY n=1 Tax=Geminicoccus sp. TaxID=2024832 RepID=UPI002E3642AD|nr:biotin transporter BioY [Geminicoccus sp.]HEX2525511.1 biotin transporter BioY [Geminicoccus sp.]